MKRRILKGALYLMGAASSVVGPMVSLREAAKAQSCSSGWTSAVAGTILAYYTVNHANYYYCDYIDYIMNYYYNGVFQYSTEAFAYKRCANF